MFPTQWSFDWRSAVIGAVVAWLIALFLYARRESLRQLGEKAWAPIARWRTRLQRSTEETYLLALREQVHQRWLLDPAHPSEIFIPPLFLAPPPLPQTFTEEFDPDRRLCVPYRRLLDGHPRVLLTGQRGEGRTAALVAGLWHLITPATGETAFTHFPLWVDLGQPAATSPADEKEDDVLEWLAQLAAQALPAARPGWLAAQLPAQPALILVDQWEAVPAEQRPQIAQRLGEAADRLPDSHWLIATGTAGYGPLVEAGFVPTELQPSVSQENLRTLLAGWAEEAVEENATLEDEVQPVLDWAWETGDRLANLTLRVWLALQTGAHPYPLREVLDQCVEALLPQPDLGEDLVDVAQQAQQAAQAVLQELAWRSRMDNETLSLQEIKETLLPDHLPPAEERPARLENAVLKLLQRTQFLHWQRKEAQFRHPVWEDLWLAHHLADKETVNVLLDYLDDSDWDFVIECYVGMAPVKPLIAALFKSGLKKNALETLLRSARWAILAPEEATWRKHVMKALAQKFVVSTYTLEQRLALGKALALVAEESAHPFFVQVLRHPDVTVRASALRGLGWTGRPRDVQTVAAGLNDEAFEVQANAVRALGDLGTPGAYRLLQDQLVNVDERLMLVIAETLAGNTMGWEALKEATRAEDLLVRRAAMHGLSQIEAPWVEEILEERMRNDSQWLVRSAAEAALSAEQATEEAATVHPPPQLDEAAWLITWAAQEGLGVGLGDAALQVLLRALDAEDPQARLLSCVTLGRLGRPEHLLALETRLQEEEHPDVVRAAEAAHRRIQARYRGML